MDWVALETSPTADTCRRHQRRALAHSKALGAIVVGHVTLALSCVCATMDGQAPMCVRICAAGIAAVSDFDRCAVQLAGVPVRNGMVRWQH